jgi:hypothetical protein
MAELGIIKKLSIAIAAKASIIIHPRMKKTIHKKKPVVKKFQPGVKASMRIRKKCNFDGCINIAVRGGVCVTHGAEKKRCSHEGCANYVQKGGVCVTHGATKKRCSHEGCTNGVVKGGVCITHGAEKKKRCSHEGCTKQAQQKGGVCVTHGAKLKRCSFEGCTNCVVKGGVCVIHGAKRERKRCSFKGCSSYAQKAGLCKRHCSKSIITLTNPVLHSNAVPPSVPPQAVDYEDEEELNSWIWGSSRMTRELGSSN